MERASRFQGVLSVRKFAALELLGNSDGNVGMQGNRTSFPLPLLLWGRVDDVKELLDLFLRRYLEMGAFASASDVDSIKFIE